MLHFIIKYCKTIDSLGENLLKYIIALYNFSQIIAS